MSGYAEEDYLPLSGIQHFLFCPRQFALIHIEQQWAENHLTVEGTLLHERAHDPAFDEKRGDRLIIRGMPVVSASLGVRGVCDIVEFRRDPGGVALFGREGTWLPVPVEYKHGSGSPNKADEAQLCAQGMCLEEMLCAPVAGGYVYHAAERRRAEVEFTDELRELVRDALEQMHAFMKRGYTPNVRKRPGCRSCSMQEHCLPALEKTALASAYITRSLQDSNGEGAP